MGYSNIDGYSRTFGDKRILSNLARNSEETTIVEYIKAVQNGKGRLDKKEFAEYLNEVREKNEYVIEDDKDNVVTLDRKNIENIRQKASGEER